MNQPILVALLTIILFLMWICIDLWKIHDDISEIRNLLSSLVAQKPKNSENIRNSQNNVGVSEMGARNSARRGNE